MSDQTFRPVYRGLSAEEAEMMRLIKEHAALLESVIQTSQPVGRYKSLALTALEEAVMWAVTGLTST